MAAGDSKIFSEYALKSSKGSYSVSDVWKVVFISNTYASISTDLANPTLASVTAVSGGNVAASYTIASTAHTRDANVIKFDGVDLLKIDKHASNPTDLRCAVVCNDTSASDDLVQVYDMTADGTALDLINNDFHFTFGAAGIHTATVSADVSQPGGDFAPQPQITTLVMQGASIMDAVVAGHTTLMERMFLVHGLTIDVRDESTGGRHVDAIQSHWETVKANYAADGDAVLVHSHILANDIIASHPYSTMSQFEIDKLHGEVASLLGSITANTNLPLVVNATFQDNERVDDSNWTNEANGSKTFNEIFTDPTTRTLSPAQWDTARDEAYASNYNWSYNYNKLLSSDGVHWTVVGSELLRRIQVDTVAAFIKGEAAPIIPKLTASEAYNIAAEPLPVLLAQSVFTATSPNKAVVGGNYFQIVGATNDAALAPLSGYNPTSLRLTSAGNTLEHGTNTTNAYPDDGVWEGSLEHAHVKRTYGQLASTTYVDLFVISGLNPNQQADIGMASYYETVDNRRAEFMFNGDTANTLICNASLGHADNVKWGTFTADANGEIAVQIRKTTGYRAHWNGTHIIPK